MLRSSGVGQIRHGALGAPGSRAAQRKEGSMETAGDRARNAASPERRADIVAAARELYEEQGLSKTSVQDITNRVGVTRSLFYHYFPDKEAVTSAVLDDYVADYLEALRL